MSDSPADVVRACLESYAAQDRELAERLIADEYVFTSPQDDRIDRAAFFDRCFPTADRFAWQRILAVVPVSAASGSTVAGAAASAWATPASATPASDGDTGPAPDGDVFVQYEYELKSGERYRNVEVSTVRDGRITETQVFFGGRVTGA
ncbi:hypothetical protein [Streptomyces sp. NPDC088725]|uniref:hypothetical protein n=1 Tax=Streptomyces sp. NPDC088725 TaxID=3365873 RepID=UPI00382CE6DF